jgi:hypothetical protein
MVGARQLAQHEGVKAIGLAARDAKLRPRGRDLVGVQRQQSQPRVQQPLDQQPVGPLDRDQPNLEAHQRAAQRPQPRLVVREAAREQLLASLVLDQDIVLLRRPVDARVPSHRLTPCRSDHFTTPRPGGTVAGAY